MAKEKVISNKELAWYISGGTITFAGLVLVVIGLIESITKSEVLRTADSKAAASLNWTVGEWGFFRLMGLIIFAVGIIFSLIVMTYNARKVDRTGEKNQRRASRHGAINLDAIDAAEQPAPVVNAQPVEPAKEEAKPAEAPVEEPKAE